MRKLYFSLFLFSFLCRVTGLAQTEVEAYNVAGTALVSTAASSSFCAADMTVDNDAGTCGAVVTYTAPAYTPPICDQTLTQTAAIRLMVQL
jgi:hypothetical protein